MPHLPTAVIDIVSGLREDTDEERDQLATNIKHLGMLQPIVVSPNPEVPGRYICIAGRRRLLATRRLGHDQIDAVIRDGDDIDREMVEITENLYRLELTGLERARHYRRMVDLWAVRNPELGEALRNRRMKNLKVGDLKADAEANGAPVEANGESPGAIEAVAAQFGVSPRTIYRAVATDRAADVFTPEQRAAVEACNLSNKRVAALAAIPDPERRGEAVNLVAAGMSYPDAMREVLGDAFEGDAEEEAGLTDEEFLAQCPIRGRVNTALFDRDALLYRRCQEAKRQFARAIGWSEIKAEIGQGGVYFDRLVRFLEAPHPRSWVQCHDCTRGKTQFGDCRKCRRGGGYLIG